MSENKEICQAIAETLTASVQPRSWSISPFLAQVISQYLQSTHAPTHKDYTMTLLDVFEVEKEGEKEAFREDLPNRSATSCGLKTKFSSKVHRTQEGGRGIG